MTPAPKSLGAAGRPPRGSVDAGRVARGPRVRRAPRSRRRLPGLPALLAAGLLLAGGAPAAAQPPGAVITDIDAAPPTPQLDGLEWTFVRIRYSSWEEQLRAFRAQYWSDPWAIDGPAAEQNLSRRLGRVTSIRVKDPVVLTLNDERLWEYPWIYFVEPGNLRLKPDEVEILREFLLRGGTATFDDFHGPIEFATVQKELRRVFPDREIVKLPLDHPVFSAFYRLTEYPQIPGLGSFFNGVTWEKGGRRGGAARGSRRRRPGHGPPQLQHRHGRRLGMVERRGLPRLHPVHRPRLPHDDQRGRLCPHPLTRCPAVRPGAHASTRCRTAPDRTPRGVGPAVHSA